MNYLKSGADAFVISSWSVDFSISNMYTTMLLFSLTRTVGAFELHSHYCRNKNVNTWTTVKGNFAKFTFVCCVQKISNCWAQCTCVDSHIDRSISITVAPQMFAFISHSFFSLRLILSRWHWVVHGNVHIDAIRQSLNLYTVNLFRLFSSSCAKMLSHESLMIVDRR